MSTSWSRVGLVGAFLLVSRMALADDSDEAIAQTARELSSLSFEELLEVRVTNVQTASKRLETIEGAPASVTVITASEIEAFGANRLIEVLSRVVGSEAMSTFIQHNNQITSSRSVSSIRCSDRARLSGPPRPP